MRTRSYKTLVPLLVVGFVFAVSGCNVLAKLKKKKTTDDPTPDLPPVAASANDVDAFNKADVTRFPDEARLLNEAAFIRVITFARTEPDSGGTTVGVIDPNTIVIKHAKRAGNTLITFDRAAFPGRRFLGWVADSAFEVPADPEPATQAATGTTPAAKAASTAAGATTGTSTAVVAGTGAPPSTGTCTLNLRTVGFTPSKSTCSFDEKVRAGSPTKVTFPCAGGSASARFSSQTFNGSASNDRVVLSHSSVTTFSGCQVRTTQTISGKPPNLSYFLSESIVGGSCKGVSTCTARATINATQ
jgi:hypothetical protein